MQTVCVKNAAPIVLSWNSWNWPFTNRNTNDDFPTADSPNNTNLNWQIFPCAEPFGRCAAFPRGVDAIFAIYLIVIVLLIKFLFVYYFHVAMLCVQ